MRSCNCLPSFAFCLSLAAAAASLSSWAMAEISVGWDVAITPTGIGEGPLIGSTPDPSISILSGSATGDNDINGVIEIPDIGDGGSANVPGAYVLQNWFIDPNNPDPHVGFEISATSGLDLSTFELAVRRERRNTPARVREISASFSTDGITYTPYLYPDTDGLGGAISTRNDGSVRDVQAIDTNPLTYDELKIWNLENYAGATYLYVKVQATYTGDPSDWNPDAVLFIDDRADLDTSAPLDGDTNTNNFFLPGSSTDGLDVILSTADRWIGTSGDWSTSTNWAVGTSPAASWDAVLTNDSSTSTLTATVSSNSTVRAVKINGTTGGMSVVVNSGTTLTSNTIVQVGDRGHLDLQGTVETMSVQIADGALLIGAGTIEGSLRVEGELSPGNSAGVLTVADDFSLADTGVLSMEIGGTIAGTDYDQVAAGNLVYLEGMLDVSFVNSFTASYGDSFEVVTAADELLGGFDSYDLPSLATGLAWGADYQADSMTLKVTLPGDHDLDGDVDGLDFLVWQREGDSKLLTGFSLSEWETYYGTAPPSSVNAVPEPTTTWLLVGFVGLFATSRPRRS